MQNETKEFIILALNRKLYLQQQQQQQHHTHKLYLQKKKTKIQM